MVTSSPWHIYAALRQRHDKISWQATVARRNLQHWLAVVPPWTKVGRSPCIVSMSCNVVRQSCDGRATNILLWVPIYIYIFKSFNLKTVVRQSLMPSDNARQLTMVPRHSTTLYDWLATNHWHIYFFLLCHHRIFVMSVVTTRKKFRICNYK